MLAARASQLHFLYVTEQVLSVVGILQDEADPMVSVMKASVLSACVLSLAQVNAKPALWHLHVEHCDSPSLLSSAIAIHSIEC